MKFTIAILITAFFFTSCHTSAQLSGRAFNKNKYILLNDSNISRGHIGICIYDPEAKKILYSHHADKYFTPASNTKLFTLYTGLKYLEDSVRGMEIFESKDFVFLKPTGDPTLLHPDFASQPVIDSLKKSNKLLWGNAVNMMSAPYGPGWAWNDYADSYMNERSAMPVFGNNLTFEGRKNAIHYFPQKAVTGNLSVLGNDTAFVSNIKREYHSNTYIAEATGNKNSKLLVPFITSLELNYSILADAVGKNINPPNMAPPVITDPFAHKIIYSRPLDSLLKPMMENSDNFFAEQTLLMASNKLLGYMSTDSIIDFVLNKDLKDLPHPPQWVDGSGLSRYNLFTPRDIVFLLEKIRTEFNFERVKEILPTGGEGTLKYYYNNINGKIFAKTGTLSNNLALSGYLITKKNKLLIFSIMANNYVSSATPVRRAIERFLTTIRQD